MSASNPTAAKSGHRGRSVPGADLSRCSNVRGHPALLDHLVGTREQRSGHFEAESLGGFEIDRKLEFSRLNDGKVGRLLTLENAAGISSSLSVGIALIGAIAHQA